MPIKLITIYDFPIEELSSQAVTFWQVAYRKVVYGLSDSAISNYFE